MRYIDSASRNTSDVLGDWLASFNPQAVDALRWQTGYFSADGLAPLVPVLNELKAQDRLTNCVIGSNGGETGEPDIEALVNLVGNPRTNARVWTSVTGTFRSSIFGRAISPAEERMG